jgi:protection-of-telomeres protein 1
MRENPQLLQDLRDQLFHLWGDLEERIAAKLPPETKDDAPTLTMESLSPASSPVQGAGDQPDVDDSDNDEADISPRAPKSSAHDEFDQSLVDPVSTHAADSKDLFKLAPKNKPFTCCIQQYGVKIPEKDRSKANAGDGKRWQRMFGIFGTTIPR